MKHRIDPVVDCVFKALLGAEGNSSLLIHFLNAMLGAELAAPITSVQILNPYNERDFPDDKLSIVDVKARDDQGRLVQIEVQLNTYQRLRARMLYGWGTLYSKQLKQGDDYDLLKPSYAIWLLADTLFRDHDDHLHDFQWRSADGRRLLAHGGIWVAELKKFPVDRLGSEQDRWLKFFKEGKTLDSDNLPEWMQTPEMRQAMSTLKHFSEQERAYHRYQARLNFLRQQRTMQREREELEAQLAQERQAREQAQSTAEQERQAKEAALAELERLKAQLGDRSH